MVSLIIFLKWEKEIKEIEIFLPLTHPILPLQNRENDIPRHGSFELEEECESDFDNKSTQSGIEESIEKQAKVIGNKIEAMVINQHGSKEDNDDLKKENEFGAKRIGLGLRQWVLNKDNEFWRKKLSLEQ